MTPHISHQELEAMQARAEAALPYEPSEVDPADGMWTPATEAQEFEAQCPLCNGNGSTDATRYDHKRVAGTICAFGIGEGYHLADTWVRHGPHDVLQLIEWGRAREHMLRELMAILFRDGGQHLETVGYDDAFEDAQERLGSMLQLVNEDSLRALQQAQRERDEALEEVRELRDALPENYK